MGLHEDGHAVLCELLDAMGNTNPRPDLRTTEAARASLHYLVSHVHDVHAIDAGLLARARAVLADLESAVP